MNKFIDNEDEHYKILTELGVLDDLEDWELFQTQEERFDLDIDLDTWQRYVKST